MSLFKELNHVSITVTDVAKAREFYSDTLGLQEIARPAFNFPARRVTQHLNRVRSQQLQLGQASVGIVAPLEVVSAARLMPDTQPALVVTGFHSAGVLRFPIHAAVRVALEANVHRLVLGPRQAAGQIIFKSRLKAASGYASNNLPCGVPFEFRLFAGTVDPLGAQAGAIVFVS